MPVPIHGPNCKTKTFWPTKCQKCGERIFFWSCTCGKEIFLELGETDLIEHECKIIKRVIYKPFKEKRSQIKSDISKTIPQNSAGDTPLYLDGVEVTSIDIVREIKQNVIDENGFLILPEMILEEKSDIDLETLFPLTESPHPIEESHIFDEIKSTGKKIPGAKPEKIRPLSGEVVDCPICNELFLYRYLFDHVSFFHKEKNAKIVLAEFNREYERLTNEGLQKKLDLKRYRTGT